MSPDPARVPFSRHTPTPWRAVRKLHVAVACDAEDAPKPIAEGLTSDGHRAFWSSRDGLITRLREQQACGGQTDVVIVCARLLAGLEGLNLLAAICETCSGARLLLLGYDTPQKTAIAAGLRKSAIFAEVLTLDSPVDVDDVRMIVMNDAAEKTED